LKLVSFRTEQEFLSSRKQWVAMISLVLVVVVVQVMLIAASQRRQGMGLQEQELQAVIHFSVTRKQTFDPDDEIQESVIDDCDSDCYHNGQEGTGDEQETICFDEENIHVYSCLCVDCGISA
jgi:competence protein ComGC